MSLSQVNNVKNSVSRSLNLCFVSDPARVILDRAQPLSLPEDLNHPTFEVIFGLGISIMDKTEMPYHKLWGFHHYFFLYSWGLPCPVTCMDNSMVFWFNGWILLGVLISRLLLTSTTNFLCNLCSTVICLGSESCKLLCNQSRQLPVLTFVVRWSSAVPLEVHFAWFSALPYLSSPDYHQFLCLLIL